MPLLLQPHTVHNTCDTSPNLRNVHKYNQLAKVTKNNSVNRYFPQKKPHFIFNHQNVGKSRLGHSTEWKKSQENPQSNICIYILHLELTIQYGNKLFLKISLQLLSQIHTTESSGRKTASHSDCKEFYVYNKKSSHL